MKECTVYIAMVLVQLAYGGSNILVKISLEKGLDQLVFVVYRHLIGTLLIGPFAYALERNQRPSLTISVIAKIFVLAALGTTIHLNVFYAGLSYTSPMVSSALSNVSPSLTFLMALALGMEKVKIKSARSQSKVVGTLVCVCGSLVFTFWKGGYLFKGFVDRPLINIYDPIGSVGEFKHSKQNWMKGSTLILTSHIAWSAWLILQAVVSKLYPAPLSLTTMICFFASLQSSLLALFFYRKPTSWRLEWNVQLLTIVYSGVVITALLYYVQTWCISKKGPVFSSMFSPLQLIIVGISSAIAFAERLHFGSLVGALLIVVGLYCVLWGKAEDNIVVVEQSTEIETGFNDTKILKISTEDVPVVNPAVSLTKGHELDDQHGKILILKTN